METPNLSGCPLCGGVASLESRAPGGTGASGMEPYMRRIGCKQCGLWIGWTHPRDEWGKQHIHDKALIDELATRWNRRAV